MLIGNSSSGIMEAASFALPVVNVGMRQQGRERARNVIDVPAETAAITAALKRAMDPAFRKSLTGMANPYGTETPPKPSPMSWPLFPSKACSSSNLHR